MGRCGKNTAMKIGSRIARARHAAGLSQTELAKLIGVNRGTVAQWEVHIKGPNRDLMMKIASATFVPVASLLSDTAPGDFIVTDRDEIVIDPFVGSGSTLMAAEATGRVCRAIEIDAQYCDLVIRRWQAQTGETAVREQDGASFAELERQAAQEEDAR